MVCSAVMHSADEIFFSLHVHLSAAGGIGERGEEGGTGTFTQPWNRTALFDHRSVCLSV